MEAIERAVEAVGGQQFELAKRIGVTPQALSQWVNKIRPVPATRCRQIEAATGGVVTAAQLRPDVFGAEPRPSRRKKPDPEQGRAA